MLIIIQNSIKFKNVLNVPANTKLSENIYFLNFLAISAMRYSTICLGSTAIYLYHSICRCQARILHQRFNLGRSTAGLWSRSGGLRYAWVCCRQTPESVLGYSIWNCLLCRCVGCSALRFGHRRGYKSFGAKLVSKYALL